MFNIYFKLSDGTELGYKTDDISTAICCFNDLTGARDVVNVKLIVNDHILFKYDLMGEKVLPVSYYER